MRLVGFLLVAISTLTVLGCNGNDGRVPVTGVVTFDGKPLESGNISFGGDQGAAGVSQIVNGVFTMNESANEKGVQPGTYEVIVNSWVEERGSVKPDGSFSAGITRIPLIYLEPSKSGLKAEVKSGEKNHFTFDLSSNIGKGDKAKK